MTLPPTPLPTALPTTDGSYLRHPDGRLELVHQTSEVAPVEEVTGQETPSLSPVAPAPAPAAVEPARKGAVKAPLKE